MIEFGNYVLVVIIGFVGIFIIEIVDLIREKP